MSAAVWIGVAALGGCGAVARFVLAGAVSARAGGELPVGTFTVNVTGAFALGVLAGAALDGEFYVLAGGATLGSFTTFSTWMLETHRLGEEGGPGLSLANLVLSLAAGLAAAALGRAVGTWL